MGENKHIKELDVFAKKYIKEIAPQKPPANFTSSLMNKINAVQKSKVFVAEPLISRKIWVVISVLISVVLLLPTKFSEQSLFEIPKVDLSFLNKFQVSNLLENISISNTVLYAIIFFGLLFIAQIAFLKNHLDKRFE